MKTLRIISDSLALARPWQGLQYKHTYAYQVQEAFQKKLAIINCATRANTIESTYNEYCLDHFFDFSTNFFVIHLGLVDSAPRVLMENNIEHIKSIPSSQEIFTFLRDNRFKLTKKYPRTYVPVEDYSFYFDSLCGHLCSLHNVEGIFIINIAAPAPETKEVSFNQWNNIKMYNKALEDITGRYEKISLINIHKETKKNPDLLFTDNQHLSHSGHKLLSNKIVKALKKFSFNNTNGERLYCSKGINADIADFYRKSILFYSNIEKARRYFLKEWHPEMFAACIVFSDKIYSSSSNTETILQDSLKYLHQTILSQKSTLSLKNFLLLPIQKQREILRNEIDPKLMAEINRGIKSNQMESFGK